MTLLAIIIGAMITVVPGGGVVHQQQQPVQFQYTEKQLLSAEQRWDVATVLAGEASVALMGEDAARAVCWTIRNRLATGLTLAQVLMSYYGRGNATEAEFKIVTEVMDAAGWDDPTAGARWVFSKQDCERLRFGPGDLVYTSPVNDLFEIHVYRTDPFRR